ncbi:MAG: polysaccharide pyruvyl transferase family protein [Bacteroidaceae bacterium]|nr:polysaccharide pyruvyl transferase family protein [Bacteroidaceae bacterium]
MGRVLRIVQRVKFEINVLRNELYGDCVPINSYAWMNYDGTIDHSNWGDDINWYFLKEVVDGHLIPYVHSSLTRYFNRANYIVIGSTIDLIADKNSIIWGAGIIDSKIQSLPKFREIRAVRGPLTRNKLLSMGYECPKVYGDPALLIPMWYNPSIEKKYRLGFIPHFHDLEMVRWQQEKEPEVKLIDVRNYKHWHDFIDEILSCEFIASSSLHGLIMAYAYNVPNVWIDFNGTEIRDSFKYKDFFASIGKDETPIHLNSIKEKEKIYNGLQKWQRGEIDLMPLINAAPFKLRL